MTAVVFHCNMTHDQAVDIQSMLHDHISVLRVCLLALTNENWLGRVDAAHLAHILVHEIEAAKNIKSAIDLTLS